MSAFPAGWWYPFLGRLTNILGKGPAPGVSETAISVTTPSSFNALAILCWELRSPWPRGA